MLIYNDGKNIRDVEGWQRDTLSGEALRGKVCSSCGTPVFRKKKFLWWRAYLDIFLCEDCAEGTLNGLNRDLAEMKGDQQAVGKKGDCYSPIILKTKNNSLCDMSLKNLRRIVELQNLLAKPD